MVSVVVWVIHELLESLPVKRDWLNPDLERVAKEEVKGKYEDGSRVIS